MKKILAVVVVIAIVAAGVVFVPELVHTCDDCGQVFFGTGYEPSVLTGIVNNLVAEEEQEVICKSCAETQHAASILLGKTLDEFKRAMFA